MTQRTWTARAILHIDMDAFFASVEQLDHPEWRGKPVIVGGSPTGRGVVSTASYEARRFGIHSAMPAAQAARRCPNAIWAPPRFSRYSELADAVCAIFSEFTPRVERVSIDEAYLDVTPTQHNPADPVSIASDIQRRVDALGLSCSIGVATTKTVAKIASDHDKPHGITVVPPGMEADFLAPLPASAIPGVGATTAARLRDVGIRTIGDLADLDGSSARQLLGNYGPELVARALGRDDRPVAEERTVKSVSNEHTFAHDVRERGEYGRSPGALDGVHFHLHERLFPGPHHGEFDPVWKSVGRGSLGAKRRHRVPVRRGDEFGESRFQHIFCRFTADFTESPVCENDLPVLDGDTPASLHARIQEQEHIAYPEALQLLAERRVRVEGTVGYISQSVSYPVFTENGVRFTSISNDIPWLGVSLTGDTTFWQYYGPHGGRRPADVRPVVRPVGAVRFVPGRGAVAAPVPV